MNRQQVQSGQHDEDHRLLHLHRGDLCIAISLAVVTLLLEMAAFWLPRLMGASQRGCLLATLVVGVVWIVLAGPTVAAGGKNWVSGLLRAGMIADATGIVLLVLWLVSPDVRFLSALKMYCVFVSLGIACIAAGRLAVTWGGRLVSGVVASVLLFGVLCSPLWIPGVLEQVPSEHRVAVASVAAQINPIYSIFASLADETGFVWHYAPLMYRITTVGEDVAVSAVRWYAAICIYLPIAGIMVATHFVRSHHLHWHTSHERR